MAEIGTSTSIKTWIPVSTAVHPASDARQSKKREQKKNNQQKNGIKHNSKKKPPDSGINSHIDEYA